MLKMVPRLRAKRSLWRGPEVDGITQSLLSRFMVCRERFRLLVVEGLKPIDAFNHRLEYGQMWHVCEEALAKRMPENLPSIPVWEGPLLAYCKNLCQRYQTQQEQIQHWYNVCMIQFPVYVDYWSKHPDVKERVPLLQEQVFDVPYFLPSGRTVRLRGKWDGVDLIGKGKNARVYLQEHKTKGDIDESQLKRQLQFDLQTMLYLIALEIEAATPGRPIALATKPLAGVRYNVVRRPLSGGKHSIRQHQPSKSNPQGESQEAFYRRLAGLIAEEPEWYFMRWKVGVTQQDLERFKREFLTPILEQLCDWWAVVGAGDPWSDVAAHAHYRTPYGFYNVLAEGGSTELDEYLATGSELGLQRTKNLFGELV